VSQQGGGGGGLHAAVASGVATFSCGGPPMCSLGRSRVDTVAALTGISYLLAALGWQLALCSGGCRHLEQRFGRSQGCVVISLTGRRKDCDWG
jgi:hypothetical protein